MIFPVLSLTMFFGQTSFINLWFYDHVWAYSLGIDPGPPIGFGFSKPLQCLLSGNQTWLENATIVDSPSSKPPFIREFPYISYGFICSSYFPIVFLWFFHWNGTSNQYQGPRGSCAGLAVRCRGIRAGHPLGAGAMAAIQCGAPYKMVYNP